MNAARDESLDLDLARERFEESTDFTMAAEEEFAILDPGTLELAHGFVELRDAAAADPVLADSLRGELIDTEVEIRSGRSES
jgi:carboxylate-amine ligase